MSVSKYCFFIVSYKHLRVKVQTILHLNISYKCLYLSEESILRCWRWIVDLHYVDSMSKQVEIISLEKSVCEIVMLQYNSKDSLNSIVPMFSNYHTHVSKKVCLPLNISPTQ